MNARLLSDLQDCLREATRQGYKDEIWEWEPTELDIKSIVDGMGYDPDADDWQQAMRWVRNNGLKDYD